MVKYYCARCGYTTNKRCNFTKHINLKRPCKPKYRDISIDIIRLNFMKTGYTDSDVGNEPYQFDVKDVTTVATVSQNNFVQYIDFLKNENRQKDETIRLMTVEREKLKQQIENLLTNSLPDPSKSMKPEGASACRAPMQQGRQNTMNNDNHTELNSRNIHQTITINNYGSENLDYIDKGYLNKLLEIPFMGIQSLIEKIHFNPLHPENHNVKIPNRKEKFAVVKKDGNWELRNKHDVIDDMVDSGYSILDCHFEEGKLVLNALKQKKFKKFQSNYENCETNLKKNICQEAELIVLNLSRQQGERQRQVAAS